jgi:halimadienyl-diphosphate synthase
LINNKLSGVLRDTLAEEIESLLPQLGAGTIQSVPYDTAWMARLALHYPGQGFDEAITWLRTRQKEDGSWGSDALYFHDRFISTLAAAVALKSAGKASDSGIIRAAENYLWRCYLHLHHDMHDTIAFPVLAVSLMNEARAVGLDVPRDLYCDVATIEKKLNMVGHTSKKWRYNTMSFSLEAAQPTYPDTPDFLEDNGSVGTSPAATAAMLIQSEHTHTASLRYLQNLVSCQGDGGAPNVSPIDTFEASWSLNFLRIAGTIDTNHEHVRRLGDFLYKCWTPDRGIGFSSYYSIPSLDDTASGFSVLSWLGYDVSQDSFASYEEETHFRCFPDEVNPSMNATLLMLGAMRMRPTYIHYEAWVDKIMNTIRRRNLDGQFYFDKWHSSPYYLRMQGVFAMAGIENDLVETTIQWMQRSQHKDGGWGFYGRSTLEETAYCLLSLVFWQKQAGGVDPQVLDAAASYLFENHNRQSLTPLWIGKCLYTPTLVVRSAILAALNIYGDYKGLL